MTTADGPMWASDGGESASDPGPGLVILAATVVALVVVTGGAFTPGPRIFTGVLLAIVAALATAGGAMRWRTEELCLLGVVVWGAGVASLLRVAPLAAKETLVAWLVALVLWVVAGRARERHREVALAVMVFTAWLLAAGVVLEYRAFRAPRVGGLLENPNVAASLLVPAIPVAWLLLGRRRRGWAVATVLVLGVAVVLSGSRAGLVALAVAAAAMVPRGRWRLVTLGVGVAGVVAFVVWRFAVQPDSLAWHRVSIWHALWRLFLTQPITGVSPGALLDSAGTVRILDPGSIGHYQRIIGHAESTPLAVLVETGVVGFAVVGWALLVWLRRAGRLGVFRDPPARAVLVSLAILAVFHDQLAVDVVLWWWALLAGLVVWSPSQRPASRAGHGARLLAAAAVGGLVLWGMVQPAIARRCWRTGPRTTAAVDRTLRAEPWLSEAPRARTSELLRRDRWTWESAAEAIALSRTAVRVHRGRASLWTNVGRVHARVVHELGPWHDSVEEARTAYAVACDLEPYLPWHFAEWAQLERSLGELERGRSLVLRALQVEPHYVRGRLLLARLELDLGRVDAARRALDEVERSRALARGRPLTRYERQLLDTPRWRLERLREAMP